MYKNVTTFFVLLLIFLSSCTPKEPQDAEQVYSDFKSEEALEKKLKIFEELKETNPDSKFLQAMLTRIVGIYTKDNEYKKAANLLEDNPQIASPRHYNSIAWGIYETKENLKYGSYLAKIGVNIARKELSNAAETKPTDILLEDWENSKKNSLAMVLDTYGCLENELGNSETAISVLEEAVNLTEEQHGDLNENYVSAILKVGDTKKAINLLENFIGNGTDSENMKSILKEVFIKEGNSEKVFDTYIKNFEENAKQKLLEKLDNEIKNEIAIDFELLDLEGKKIKLSDFKGKTVVLDFWATWCGPCLQSMPAMKKAMAKFPDVKFLFANTWERVEDKKQNALDFLAKNDYPFHVLMDDENKIVEKYKVRGIPTKFIIDKNQKIRFESIGFSGKEDELLLELELMFSMIK